MCTKPGALVNLHLSHCGLRDRGSGLDVNWHPIVELCMLSLENSGR